MKKEESNKNVLQISLKQCYIGKAHIRLLYYAEFEAFEKNVYNQ